MNKTKYYERLFKAGGIFNWIMSVGFILISSLYPEIFKRFGTEKPPTLFFLHSLMILIFTFGIGYYIVGMDPSKNRGCVILGVVSKMWFFGMCVLFVTMGDLKLILVAMGSLDFIWACFFIEFLVYNKKQKNRFLTG